MRATRHLGCDRCDYAVTTVAPRRLADGRLVARLYCPGCGEVREWSGGAAPRRPTGPLGVPLGPRQGQAGRLAAAIAGRLRDDDAVRGAACPACGGRELLLAPAAGRAVPCPRCGQGHLRARP